MAYTGGKLNELNGKHGISAATRSVPVMKLIKNHKPRSKDELYNLIKYHFENDCPCGIKSKGTVENFGRNLYEAQKKEWGEYRFSLQECIQWEYDLFVVQSLKGTRIEKTALDFLQKTLSPIKLKPTLAEGFVDEELRVDLIIEKNKSPLCGIQVKPLTFNKMREGVISFNNKANEKWGKPVYYLFYDDSEKLINVDQTVSKIIDLI